MDARLNYIFAPSTLISLITALITVAAAWTNLKSRVDAQEREIRELKGYHMEVEIAEMKKDIQYMKNDIQYMRETLDRVLSDKK